MAQRTATLYARVEPDVKDRAEAILAELGIPASNAINMFYKQIILRRGLPFDVRLPERRPLDASLMEREELYSRLEEGYGEVVDGHTRPAPEVFVSLNEEYGT